MIDENEALKLEEWIGLICGEIIFDSKKDNWKENESIFNERIKGRKQLLFIIEDERNEKFGYYLNSRIYNKYDQWMSSDIKSFEFNTSEG